MAWLNFFGDDSCMDNYMHAHCEDGEVMYQSASFYISINILYVTCLYYVADVGLQSSQKVNSMKWRLEFCMVMGVVFSVEFFYTYVWF